MNRKGVLVTIFTAMLIVLFFSITMEKDEDINIGKENIKNEEGEEKAKDQAQISDISLGEPAPDFTLLDLQGKEVSLSDYRGKTVLINFWATWCKWCDIEMPDLQKLQEENEDVVVLAVDVMEKKSTVEEYIEDGGYDFKVLLDEKGKIASNYLVGGLPVSYFVNKEGILVSSKQGMMNYP